MSRAVRPKRAGEDYARTHQAEEEDEINGPSTTKKPRFDIRNPSALAPDELEDDAVLDADEIGRRGQGVRRNAVNLDGYQSDSENEGFDARVEAKAKAKRRQQKEQDGGDDDDMFADDAAEEVDNELGEDEAYRKSKKNVRFLSIEEIEGQANRSRGGRAVHVDLSNPTEAQNAEDVESESESEVDEEERARVDEGMDEEVGAGGKKTHAPLIDAFNMRAEQEEGRFDESGNFVRKAVDPDAIHDTWLDGLSKKDIRRAKEAAEKRENERRERDKQNDSIITADLLRTLIIHMQRGETVLEALARLGKGLRKKPKWQKNKNRKVKENGGEDVEMTEENPEETRRRKAIDDVTGAADLLLTRGQTEIYDQEREMLTRQFRRETGENWVDPPEVDEDQVAGDVQASADSSSLWEYRWSDARDGGETHGPYDGAMMQSWNDAGYFGEGVEFRKVGGAENDWGRVTSFS